MNTFEDLEKAALADLDTAKCRRHVAALVSHRDPRATSVLVRMLRRSNKKRGDAHLVSEGLRRRPGLDAIVGLEQCAAL